MSRLTIFPNDPQKDVETQLQNINLALENVRSWSNRIGNKILLQDKNESANQTSSTSFVDLYNIGFKNTNNLVSIYLNLGFNSNGNNAEFVFIVDGTQLAKSINSINGKNNHIMSAVFTINQGTHNLQIQWKTNAGTINKIEKSGSNLIIIN